MPNVSPKPPTPYRMKISRLTVDKLGVKLYDRVSAVIAELVANSYDADATEVIIEAPMGGYLASRAGGLLTDKGSKIVIKDNGIGMTPEQVNDFYLVEGKEGRADPRRGDTSPRYGRKVMGRKGVGKLAPFGICNRIEVISAGGEMQAVTDNSGAQVNGYLIAHLILDRHGILTDTDDDYFPAPGQRDGTPSPDTGTTLVLSDFGFREVPKLEEMARQMAQRFGVQGQIGRLVSSTALRLKETLTVPD